MKQKDIYKTMSMINDIKAASNGRIIQRIWNKIIMKMTRKFLK